MVGILAIVAVTLVLGSSAGAQVKFKTLYSFHGKDGAYPTGPLTFDAAGNLYSTTYNGGLYTTNCAGGISNSCGTAYELTPNANRLWTHKVLHYFTANEDYHPFMGMTFDTAGNLYGETNGGNPNQGDVYELTPQPGGGWSYTVLWQDGEAYYGNPQGGVAFDSAGNLYGTSAWGCGDSYGWGQSCVFEMTPGSGGWTFDPLYLFTFMGSTGWYPNGTTPIFDAKGNLYATAELGGLSNAACSFYGCGVVFELSPDGDGTWTFTDLYNFTGGKDGGNPICPLVLDASGNLYGTTSLGGAYGKGNVFKLTPNGDGTWTLDLLHQFTGGKDGSMPLGGVIFDAAGNLYGTTSTGGDLSYCNGTGCGVVFKLTPTSSGGWREVVLHTFIDKRDGAYPGWTNVSSGDLIFDAAGNLYGTTTGNGTTTFGTVYEITP